MKYKNKMIRSLGTLLLLASASASKAGGIFADLDTLTNFQPSTANKFQQALYMNYAIKINDRYSVTPELLNYINYRSAGKNGFNVQHGYLRVLAMDNSLAKVGDWTLQMGYRYVLPTSLSAQMQGTYGTFSFRPQLTNKFGDFSMMARLIAALHLQRDGRSVIDHTTPNPLVTGGIELVPQYAITDRLTFSVDLYFASSYHGVAIPNVDATGKVLNTSHFSNEFLHNYEIAYRFESLGDAEIGFYIEHDNVFGSQGAKFDLFSKNAEWGLTAAKQF